MPLLAQLDYVGVAAIVAPVLLALLGVAWKLGGLERSVNDVREDVTEMKGQIRDLSRGPRR